MSLDPRMAQSLVCPTCKGRLIHDEEKSVLVCLRCNLAFAVENSIPNMIAAEARELTAQEVEVYKQKK